MKYLTVIFLFTIAVYNFQPADANYVMVGGVYIWQFIWHMAVDVTMLGLFYSLARKTVTSWERRIYYGGAVFMAFYTIFNLLTLTSDSASEYLARVNNVIWGAVSGSLILLIIILQLYDKRRS